MFPSMISSLLALASCVAATKHIVNVGENGLQYSPNSTIAGIGDVVEFHYFPKNHSVVQGDFSNPCISTHGFYSGYVPSMAGEAAKTFSIVVNDTAPIYFYCSQPALGGHCAHGMVGCINCPTVGATLAAYALAAMNTTNVTVTHPPMVGGGYFSVANSSMANTTASMSVTAPTATSSMAMYTGAAQVRLPETGVAVSGFGLIFAAFVL